MTIQSETPNLTLAIVTDIHHGADRSTKMGSAALPLLGKFGEFVASLSPDVIVEMGDRISDQDRETDLILMKDVAAAIEQIPGDWHHLIGNHDVAELTVAENEDVMQRSFAHESIDRNGVHLVFWNLIPKIDRVLGFTITVKDLEWLAADLAAAELPTVICTHVPLDNGSMKGNYYFETVDPHFSAYPEVQGKAIRKVIESSGKVILCLNGHTHWNAYHCIDGIHYVTLPSLTERFTTWPEPNAAFSRVRIGETIDIEVLGLTPMSYRLPIRKAGHHWVNVDKSYSPVASRPG
jgi:calcineurin-like phosphoesterase family protein